MHWQAGRHSDGCCQCGPAACQWWYYLNSNRRGRHRDGVPDSLLRITRLSHDGKDQAGRAEDLPVGCHNLNGRGIMIFT